MKTATSTHRRLPGRALLAAAALLTLAAAPAGEWRMLGTAQGVSVELRPLEGRTLPEFRATGEVAAGLYEVLAVIQDVEQHPSWQPQCVAARVLERKSDREGWIYNRTDWPWPIADRDAVLYTKIDVLEPKRRIQTRFVSRDGGPNVAVPYKVVRMPHLQGVYELEALDSGRTRVEFAFNVEPGRRLPLQVVARATRDLALNTVINLRRQVERTRGSYSDFVEDWSGR